MKYLLLLTFMPALLQAKEDRDCEDLAWSGMTRYVIVQKIESNVYELGSSNEPNFRAILKTHRAEFNGPGFPFGIKAKHLIGEHIDLPLQNGFRARYGVYEECGIVPLPDHAVMWEAGMSVRNRIKKIDGVMK